MQICPLWPYAWTAEIEENALKSHSIKPNSSSFITKTHISVQNSLQQYNPHRIAIPSNGAEKLPVVRELKNAGTLIVSTGLIEAEVSHDDDPPVGKKMLTVVPSTPLVWVASNANSPCLTPVKLNMATWITLLAAKEMIFRVLFAIPANHPQWHCLKISSTSA